MKTPGEQCCPRRSVSVRLLFGGWARGGPRGQSDTMGNYAHCSTSHPRGGMEVGDHTDISVCR